MRVNSVSICVLLCTLVCLIFNGSACVKLYELDKQCTEPVTAYLSSISTRQTSKNVGLTLQYVTIPTACYMYEVDNNSYSIEMDYDNSYSISESLKLRYDKDNPSINTFDTGEHNYRLIISIINCILLFIFGCIVAYVVGIPFG